MADVIGDVSYKSEVPLHNEIIEYFAICPISQEIMIDPVVSVDGFTFDRLYIEQWFATGHHFNPTTGLALLSFTLIPNYVLRKLAQHVLCAKPIDERKRIRDRQTVHFAEVAVNRMAFRLGLGPRLGFEEGTGHPLHKAAASGDVSRVRTLCEVDGANVQEQVMYAVPQLLLNGNTRWSQIKRSPLCIACMHGHMEVVQYLCSRSDCDLLDTDTHANTALHAAAFMGHEALLRYLVDEHKLDVNRKNKHGSAPMFNAIDHGHLEAMKTLYEYGSEVHQVTPAGFTDLHWACFLGYIDIVRYLCWDKGVDSTRTTDDGITATDLGGFQGKKKLLNAHISQAILSFLKSREETDCRKHRQGNLGRGSSGKGRA